MALPPPGLMDTYPIQNFESVGALWTLCHVVLGKFKRRELE